MNPETFSQQSQQESPGKGFVSHLRESIHNYITQWFFEEYNTTSIASFHKGESMHITSDLYTKCIIYFARERNLSIELLSYFRTRLLCQCLLISTKEALYLDTEAGRRRMVSSYHSQRLDRVVAREKIQ